MLSYRMYSLIWRIRSSIRVLLLLYMSDQDISYVGDTYDRDRSHLGVTSNWEASCLRNMLSLAFCHISGICHILGNMSQFGNTLNREASCHKNMSSQATCHLSGIFRIGIFQIGINHTEAICQIMVYYILGSLHIRFTHISMRREMRM